MGRTARKKSSTGIYHVIVRGVNREPIFYEDEDRFLYLESLAKAKKKAVGWSERLFKCSAWARDLGF